VLLLAALMMLHAAPSFAYLKLGTSLNGRLVELRWNRTVRYYINESGAPGIDAASFQAALTRAFNTWEAVPTASIAYEFGGFTAGRPGEDDGWSTFGFRNEPDLDRVLASTTFLVDEATGELIESDVFFNSAFDWSIAVSGGADRFDLETIALHEIGHMSGLGHSAIGETVQLETGRRVLAAGTVMFPIAFPAGTTFNRVLTADDIAGLSDLYPDRDVAEQTGSLSGRVTKNGQGVFGAHVVAFNPLTGALVGNFALSARGDFSIARLTPGTYVVRVEPLDDADVDGFFMREEPPDVDFRVAFAGRLVVVPRGGDSGIVPITVVAK